MADEIDLTETIVQEAQLPAASASDGQSAEARPLKDLIAADKHLGTKQALSGSNSGWRGLRAGRVIPPGGV